MEFTTRPRLRYGIERGVNAGQVVDREAESVANGRVA